MIKTINTLPVLGKAALLAAPLALGALVLNSTPTFAALGADTPTATFERVQFADVIEAARPAVVQIAVSKTLGQMAAIDGRSPFPGGGAFEEFMRRFGARQFGPFANPAPGQAPHEGMPDGGVAEGLGSGFIIDNDGYIVTNNHVVSDATTMKVTLHDGREFPAHLVGSDPQTDLALIKIDADHLPTIAFGNSDRTRVGDWVVAIGSPFGFGGSVTAGIVSARGRDIRSGPYDDYLQIDAPINSGNSGGPVIDASGHVVGVNTAIFSPNGGNIGIGFAIPASDAERVVAQLKTDGSVSRGRLGVQIQGINDAMAEALGLDSHKGALVAEVVPDSAAARAGIRTGDVITAYGDAVIAEPRDLSKAVARTEPGSKMNLMLLRSGKSVKVTAIVDRADTPQLAAAGQPNQATSDTLGLGLALGSISPEARSEMQLDDDASGALVLGVKAGGVADNSGIQPGDIIVNVDRQQISSAEDAESALAAAKRDARPSVVLLRRGGAQFFTTMKVA